MTRRIIVHEAALYDTIDIAHYISDDSLSAADRFVDALDAAYQHLADTPTSGAIRTFANSALKSVCMWPVREFPNYLIFYQTTDEELHIVRVLHGARDIDSILGQTVL